MTTPLRVSSQGLQNILLRGSKPNFLFVVGGNEYPCQSFFADFISPRIAQIHLTDPLYDKFVIRTEDEDKNFQLIIDLMHGIPIHPTSSQCAFIRKMAAKLRNEELFVAFSKQDTGEEKGSLELFNLINQKYKLDMDYTEEANLIAEDIHNINKSNFTDMPVEMILKIISSPKLLLDSEDELFQLVSFLMEKDPDVYSPLLNHIVIDNLSPEAMSNFLTKIPPQYISQIVWNGVKSRLQYNVEPISEISRFHKLVTHCPFAGDAFQGIAAMLHGRLGENPTGKFFRATTRGQYNQTLPDVLFSLHRNSTWGLYERENNFLQLDFMRGLVALSAYSFRGGSNAHWDNPQSWVMETSMDGVAWTTVDERKNNTEMGGNETFHTWTLSQPAAPARFLRWRLTQSRDSGSLQCKQFEIFGDYLEPDNEKAEGN